MAALPSFRMFCQRSVGLSKLSLQPAQTFKQQQLPSRNLHSFLHNNHRTLSRHSPPSAAQLLRPSSISRSVSTTVITRPTAEQSWRKLAFAGLGIVGGVVAINAFFNRETRAALSTYESDYLRSTFGYVGAGLGIVTLTAVSMHRNGLSLRLMRANPWLVVGGSLVASIGSMFGVYYTDPDHTGQKLFFWTAFQAAQAATLSPLLFLQ